ncbi:uncharacterized protein N7511_006156 [Penicillium nucicola]|uniref:uncharacterized protein n=1 Tax=Penicillium nucicola TaxID=1850975 RepID=UPI002545A7E4|nr:uncharacterized protein N7511_006156 [Penicillium nucicola]KAJ5757462.1 hypothetical protein N7511_006156 [Penicillium nucicola]
MVYKSVLVLALMGSLPFVTASPKKHHNEDHKHSKTSSTSSSHLSSISVPPLQSYHTSNAHTPFMGTPCTTGALTASSVGTGISSGGVMPEATSYPADGLLHHAEPAAYYPAGGVGTNGSIPVYNTKSDFDFESLALALYQEWIELDLFQYALRRFSKEDFKSAGLTDADRELIAFMAQQEIGHATMLSNILGTHAPQQCSYVYPFTNVQQFIDFAQKLTRFGEAGVYGFLAHLDSREAATLLTQSIATEARQQLIFHQFEGLFSMVEWFEVGIPQSWAWTLLAPFISSCPENQTRLIWQNFPALTIVNQPNPYDIANSTLGLNETGGFNQTGGTGHLPDLNNTSGIDHTRESEASYSKPHDNSRKHKNSSSGNSSSSSSKCGVSVSKLRPKPLSFPGRNVVLQWDTPGKKIGPNDSYVTTKQAGLAKYVVWVSQLNITYTPLHVDNTSNSTRGWTSQPGLETYQGDPAFNGTIFIAVTDSDPYLSPFNLSLINSHVVAGPALYQAG